MLRAALLLDASWVSGTSNTSPVDEWTIIHILAGVALALTGATPAGALVANAAFEAWEQVMERNHPNPFGSATPETLGNVAFDVAVTLTAYTIVKSQLA